MDSYYEAGRKQMQKYFDDMFEARLPEIRRALTAGNPNIDPEFMGTVVESLMAQYKNRYVDQVHALCTLIISHLISGNIGIIQHFDALFTDLVERTLLREAERWAQASHSGRPVS
jgi:hypothetical protein